MAQNSIPYSATPTVSPSTDGSGASYQSVPQASPNAFGAQIGDSLGKLGQSGEEVGNRTIDVGMEFQRMATESKAENDFANTYATGAAQLRQKFDGLDDKDKIAGSVEYVNGLKGLGQQFTGDDAEESPYYKKIMGQLIGRHVFAETTGIDREVVNATSSVAAQSKLALMAANNGYAAQNYANSKVVDQMEDSNAALRTLQVMHAGHDLSSPEGASLLDSMQRNDRGMMADAMVKAAVNDGDIAAAMRIRGNYSTSIPGYQQLAQDNLIQAASMKQFGPAGVSSLASGQYIPQVTGAPPSHIQALVANTAQTSGINPNDALTVAQIESSMGTNVGKRGTIGQDKASAGQSIDEQAKALCDNWKAAHDPAATALGREPQGWEQYMVYQQGAGGGAALLKADPNAKAVDILRPMYANPKDSLSAVTNNGGNAAMTVSDFLDQEKQRWTASAERANCDFKDGVPPGDQIANAHQNQGVMVQPGANPAQDYRNWQRANILNLQQIMSMPNGPAREALVKENQMQTQKREIAASSYKSDLVNQASQLAQSPSFTSMAQVSPEMHSALLESSPYTLDYMERKADYNTKHQAGVSGHDETEYGSGYKNVLNDVWDKKITSPEQLHEAVAKNQLTIAGYDLMLKQLPKGGREDAIQKQNETDLNKRTFAAVENTITHGSSKDVIAMSPAMQKTVQSADMALFNAIDERKSRNIPPSQYYDPENKEYIGNDAKVLKISHAQAVAAQIRTNQAAAKPRTLADIVGEAKTATDPAQKSKLRQEAIDLGFYDPNAPAVPLH